MAGNLQLPRRGDFARDAGENGSAVQGLRALHCGSRRYPKCGGTGRGWKAVPNARRIQQAAAQKASETSVNLRSDGWNLVGPKRIGDVLIIQVHPELPIPFFVSPPDILPRAEGKKYSHNDWNLSTTTESDSRGDFSCLG